MNIFYLTKRLNIRYATEEDINYIMETERSIENKDFIFQGTYESHKHEINANELLLLIIEKKIDNEKIGFFLSSYDQKSDVFELRRIAINLKNQGYGYELILGLMEHVFNNLSINRFWLDVFDYNKHGIHIYEKLGMQRDGIIREGYKSNGIYKSYYIYSILKNEYFEKFSI
ncbi:GNAT family protein [Clostridiaceae bacterium HSG29]|nr:GNAT family protein [Clostridiaceae bacterium HSG29]